MYARKIIPKWTVVLSIVAALLNGTTMLQLVNLKVPLYTISGQPVRLECHYDLEGEALYSVKWFKDDKEFYRFYPEDDPPARLFPVIGLLVDLQNSSDTTVVLKSVDVAGSGDYKCEVSAEAPAFKTTTLSKTMIVVDLPDASGPQIDGVKARYQIGETAQVNCTSSRSRPAADLAWYINQEPADESFLRYYPVIYHEDGFQTAKLGLEFKVRQKHFKKGDLKVKCLAKIASLYWRSNEESVDGDRPRKAPVLESRETFPDTSHASASLKLSSTFYWLLSLSVLLNTSMWLRCNDAIHSLLKLYQWLSSFSSLVKVSDKRSTHFHSAGTNQSVEYLHRLFENKLLLFYLFHPKRESQERERLELCPTSAPSAAKDVSTFLSFIVVLNMSLTSLFSWDKEKRQHTALTYCLWTISNRLKET